MNDLLEQLNMWCLKHRTYSIQGGPFCQPGDGSWVTLYDSRTRRKVHINECDPMFDTGPDEGPAWPTPAQLLAEALRRWAVLEANGELEWPEVSEPEEVT